EGGTLMRAHVDDVEVFGKPMETKAVVDLLKKHKLKIKLEGRVKVGEGESAFLKRTFLGIPGGIEIRMDGKYLEKLEEILGLGKAHPKKLPFLMEYGRSLKDETPLNAEEHHLYRSCVGVFLYMKPERPDLGFDTKWLSGKLAAPTRGKSILEPKREDEDYEVEKMSKKESQKEIEETEEEKQMEDKKKYLAERKETAKERRRRVLNEMIFGKEKEEKQGEKRKRGAEAEERYDNESEESSEEADDNEEEGGLDRETMLLGYTERLKEIIRSSAKSISAVNFLNELLEKAEKEMYPIEKITERVQALNLEREDKPSEEEKDVEMAKGQGFADELGSLRKEKLDLVQGEIDNKMEETDLKNAEKKLKELQKKLDEEKQKEKKGPKGESMKDANNRASGANAAVTVDDATSENTSFNYTTDNPGKTTYTPVMGQ
ncbi:unnamed protein product, partial [Symbiodinium microadriaticum]